MGPKKLIAYLGERFPSLELPSASTVGDILTRAGLVKPSKRRSRFPKLGGVWPRGETPNAIWCVDYKGEFRMKNSRYCYPLTITDEMSRYIIRCTGFESIAGLDVRRSMERSFRQYGLPDGIRSDGGTPFYSNGNIGLSSISVWWLRLGIALRRIQPGHPEQNGRHERMHRDLKAHTTRPPGGDLRDQQRSFDQFRSFFNNVRPHEGLDQQTPAKHYRPSKRPFPNKLPQCEYPGHYEVRRVAENGTITFCGAMIFISKSLEGEDLGLVEIDEDLWAFYLGSHRMGTIDAHKERVIPWFPEEETGIAL
jgi:transposase InsO family protein